MLLLWSLCFFQCAGAATLAFADVTDATVKAAQPCICLAQTDTLARSDSPQQDAEHIAGCRLANLVMHESVVANKRPVSDYINSLERSVVTASHLNGCFLVTVILDDSINAYSLPGGFIYVTSGLILAIKSEGQLVAALAHETAHITARHYSRFRVTQAAGRRLALLGGPAGMVLRLSIGPFISMMRLRRFEFEADRIGFAYYKACGYDAVEFSNLLQTAFQDEETDGGWLARLHDTHPLTHVRMKRLRSYDHTVRNAGEGKRGDQAAFYSIQRELEAMLQR